MQNISIRNSYCKTFSTTCDHSDEPHKQGNAAISLCQTLTKYAVVVILCVLLCLATGTAVHAATPGKNSLTPAQLLQKSADAMKQLKAFSFDVNMTATTTTTDSPHPSSLIMQATGVWVLPDRTQMQLSMNQGATTQTFTIAEIIAGQKLYIQDTKGQWYVLDKPSSGNLSNPFSGLNVPGGNLPDPTKNATIKDNGTVILHGISVRHLTLTINGDALKNLSNQPAKPSEDVTVKNAIIDIWIDEATAYVQQIQLQFELVTAAASATSPSRDTSANIIADYSKFNDSSLKVTVPENPLPFPTDDTTKPAK